MSNLTKIISEIASYGKAVVEDVAKDLASAQKLDPVVLVASSALEAAKSEDSFKDRVIDNATEGARALGRLGERFVRFSGPGLSTFWTGPALPSVILKDFPASRELQEVLQNYAEPSPGTAGCLQGARQTSGGLKAE